MKTIKVAVISCVCCALLAVLAVLAGIGCGGNRTYEYRLTYSVFFPSVHVQSLLAVEWGKELERRTNGRVKVDVFSGSVLSGASENYDCVANGVSDIGMSCLAYSRGLFPLSECLDFPFGYPDGKTATLVANDFLEHFKPPEFNETKMLYLHAHGPGVLATRKHVTTLEDIRNLSIRGTGITAQVIRQLNGNAVGLPQGETFEALRKGVVQATLCPIETLKGWKQGEVIDEVVTIPAIGYTTAMFVTMNRQTWNKLPPDIQKIILQLNREWCPKHGAAWDDADDKGRDFVRTLGKKFYTFDDTQNRLAAEKIEPMLGQWAEQAEQKGVPGREAVAFIKERLAFYKKQQVQP